MNPIDQQRAREFLNSEHAKDIPEERTQYYRTAWGIKNCSHDLTQRWDGICADCGMEFTDVSNKQLPL